VPGETFTWGQHLVATHLAAKSHHCKGMAYMTRHLLLTTNASSPTLDDASNASHAAYAIEQWSQAETCAKAAYLVQRASKAFLIGYLITHLLLLLSALAVFKRACRLRCAAARLGLLQCAIKKCAAKRFFNRWKSGGTATITTPGSAEGSSPATKELA